MNEVINTIKNRRSTRAFKETQIPESEVNTIIEAGIFAPSAMNEQSWHFTVIQNKEIIDKLSDAVKAMFREMPNEHMKSRGNNEKYHVFYNAPTIIIVSGNEKSLHTQADCDAATQNMLLASTSLDVASCWIGVAPYFFKSEGGNKFKKELNIPDGFNPFNIISLGYKAMDSKAPARKEGTVTYIK